jgi:hypothetical protein
VDNILQTKPRIKGFKPLSHEEEGSMEFGSARDLVLRQNSTDQSDLQVAGLTMLTSGGGTVQYAYDNVSQYLKLPKKDPYQLTASTHDGVTHVDVVHLI